jgi:hypothetical protein
MADARDIECLRYVTNLQTGLVLREVRLAEGAVRRGSVLEDYEDQDDANAFHLSRGRPTALIILFPKGRC